MILGYQVKPPSAVMYPLVDDFDEQTIDVDPIDPLDEDYIEPIEP